MAVLSRVIALWSESDDMVPKTSLEIGRRLRRILFLLFESLVSRKTRLSRLVEGSGSGPKTCGLMSSSRQLQLFPVADWSSFVPKTSLDFGKSC
jgi:hypothetical protein